jgi:hypothetical protein
LENSHYSLHITRCIQNQCLTPKNPHTTKVKWATFTYLGPETRTITKLFKNRDTGIAFKTTNTLTNNLNQNKE